MPRLSAQYDDFARRVAERRGMDTQTDFATNLSGKSPRPVLSGYISQAETKACLPNGTPSCPLWFVKWFCEMEELQIPPEYAGRKERSPSRGSRAKSAPPKRPEPVTVIDSNTRAVVDLSLAEGKKDRATIKELQRAVKTLNESLAAISAGLPPTDLQTIRKLFEDAFSLEVDTRCATLHKKGDSARAKQLLKVRSALLTTIKMSLKALEEYI